MVVKVKLSLHPSSKNGGIPLQYSIGGTSSSMEQRQCFPNIDDMVCALKKSHTNYILYVTIKYALDSIRSIQNQRRHQCPFDLCGHCNQCSSQELLDEVVQHINAYPLHLHWEMRSMSVGR